MRDITAIGSTTRDVFLEVDFPTVKWSKTPTGKAFVLPLGEKLGVKTVYFTIGGNAANASVTFARQGLKTALFTKVGDDVSGHEIKLRLNKEGVDTKLVDSSAKKTSYSVLILEKGERTILNYPGAINEFSLRNAKEKDLASKWWYVSLPAKSYKLFPKILKMARKKGIKVALNPSGYHIEHGRSELLNSLKYISFLVLNNEEASKLTGIPFRKEKMLFRRLDQLVPGIVAVTFGRKGVVVSDGQLIYRAGIFSEKRLIDRTGAGDTFGSGFVAGLMRKNERCEKGVCKPANIEYAIRLASANATSVVEHIGATEGILTRREFDTNPRWKKIRIKRN